MKDVDWAEVAASGYAVPEGLHALGELLGMLGSEDPELRDAQAYSTLAHWIGAGHFDGVLLELGDRAASGLRDDNVLVRSFSALILGEAVQRDARRSIVGSAARHLWMEHWQFTYPHERDVRSFDLELGWIHSVAHGADTARAFALHPATTAADLRMILDALTERLRSLPLHLSQTEDDRLALALLAVLTRPELTGADVQAWLADYRTLWTDLKPGPIPPGPVLAVRTLQSLHTLLHLGATVDGMTLHPAYPEDTLAAVQGALRSVYPYYGEGQAG